MPEGADYRPIYGKMSTKTSVFFTPVLASEHIKILQSLIDKGGKFRFTHSANLGGFHLAVAEQD